MEESLARPWHSMMPVIEMTRMRLSYVVNTMTRFEYDSEGIDMSTSST